MRKLYESFRLSWRALGSHRLRTLLTMLGISIGIFSITFIFTLVNTLEFAIVKNLEKLGNTVLYVHNWPWRDASEDWFKFINRPRVSYDDYQKLKNNLDNVVGVYYEVSLNGTVKAGDRNMQGVGISGVTFDHATIEGYNMDQGRYFSSIEMEAGRPVCIIGVKIAEGLFEQGPYVGRYVQVRGKRFRVIGVMEKEGSSLFGTSRDEMVIMPYKSAAMVMNLNSRRVDKVISVKATQYDMLDQVEGETIGLIRQARGLKPSQEDDFSINRQEMLLTGIQSIMDVLRVGGFVIGMLALLVGGFGIANIMFVSVKERTAEIGTQKALGATKQFILNQFLIEAVLLCVFGGAIGIAFLSGIAALAQMVLDRMDMNVTVVMNINSVVGGIMASAVIGILSGFLPAFSAAQLDPVEAMRQQ